MELPKELIDKYKRQKKIEDDREKKVKAKIHYKRRKLNKEINKYVKACKKRISGEAIGRIGSKHGFHVKGTLFRENQIPSEDA